MAAKKKATCRIGTSGYQYDHWEGVLYPEDVPQADWFDLYAETFDAVEINNTFYNLPEAAVRQSRMIGHAGSSRGKTLKRPIHGLFAEDEAGRFFVVLTFQKGPAPQIQVKGKGLGAVATVGRRTVRFDGKAIVFGEAK